MSAASDLALMSSIRSQIEDLQLRITTMADSYAGSPDSQVAAELFGAERALRTVGRTLDRAADLLRRA